MIKKLEFVLAYDPELLEWRIGERRFPTDGEAEANCASSSLEIAPPPREDKLPLADMLEPD